MVQLFPADEHSRALFEEHGIPQSAANVWSLEIVPGERFSYVLRRPGRHFQVDFDLSEPVEPPPPPWGLRVQKDAVRATMRLPVAL